MAENTSPVREQAGSAPSSAGVVETTGVRPGSASLLDSLDFGFSDPQALHVWSVSLEISAAALNHFKSVLSRREGERAERFRFDLHRDRYIAAHGQLRELLARYLSVSPAALDFDYGPKGKPVLKGLGKSSQLQFNLAHSDGLALVAISPRARVGVDLERVRTLPDAEELVARFFSRRETERFRALGAEQRDQAFFNLWTRKEAWLKATGEGITHLLAQVEVSFLPGESAQLLSLPKDYAAVSAWSLWDLAPAADFAGAVAVESNALKPLLRSWQSAFKEGST